MSSYFNLPKGDGDGIAVPYTVDPEVGLRIINNSDYKDLERLRRTPSGWAFSIFTASTGASLSFVNELVGPHLTLAFIVGGAAVVSGLVWWRDYSRQTEPPEKPPDTPGRMIT